jgi:hypothetical protein
LNSIWNKNRRLFTQRFPELSSILRPLFDKTETEGSAITDSSPVAGLQRIFPFWEFVRAKNGSVTVREQGIYLHSAYNPERESSSLAAAPEMKDTEGFIFFSCGAGYAPVALATVFQKKPLIIIEPDPQYLLAAFSLIDWEPVFRVKNCMLAVNCPEQTVLQLLDQNGLKIPECAIISNQAQRSHAAGYFAVLDELFVRNRRAEQINTRTLERFAGLWLRNSCRNIRQLADLDGVSLYRNAADGRLPFCILAAGPSLAAILPYLSEIKKRAIIVCVETALRACLAAGVEPDFIIIIDPQYYAALHLAGLAAPASVLITESAVYPSVFRFPCRKKVLCSSLFPLGHYFEQRMGSKGKLGEGGSVSTTAWDFARLCGAKEIYLAGLDLGFPDKKTHIQGSRAEENFHILANRMIPAETSAAGALYGPDTRTGTAYDGTALQTDSRMELFAWWFESRIAGNPEQTTYTFSTRSLRIPGVHPCPLPRFLEKPEAGTLRSAFFSHEQELRTALQQRKESFEKAFRDLTASLEQLKETAYTGMLLCKNARTGSTNYRKLYTDLARIDRHIAESGTKETVSLVFPTTGQLTALIKKEKADNDPTSVQSSYIIYREIVKAVDRYLVLLKA